MTAATHVYISSEAARLALSASLLTSLCCLLPASSSQSLLLQALASGSGTWVNGKPLAPGHKQRLLPQDTLEFGVHPASEVYRVKMQHVSLATGGLNGHSYTVIPVGHQAKDMVPSPVAA